MGYTLVNQLFELQILEGQDYIHKFEVRTTKKRVLKSIRGNIYDRNGLLIASNILSYSVTFEDNGSYESTREKNLTLNGVAYQVYHTLKKNGDSLSMNNFHIKVEPKNDLFIFDVDEGFTLNRFRADIFGYPLIDSMKEEEKNATADDMMQFLLGSRGFSVILEGSAAYKPEELEAHHLPEELTKEDQLAIAYMRYMLSTNSFKKYMRVTIATNVSDKSVAALMENQANLQGIDVIEDSRREYIEDESMGLILGYTGQASAEELINLRQHDPSYPNDAIVGKAGIEQYMEIQLQGKDGEETVSVDNLGKILRIDKDTQIPPVAGYDVYLTIDSDWQSAIYKILEQRVAGILLSKIEAIREFPFNIVKDAAAIKIPIYDVYNALIDNSVLNFKKFGDEGASDIEKEINAKFLKKQEKVFTLIRKRLTDPNPPVFNDESPEVQEYMKYIANDLLRDNLGIIRDDYIDHSDKVYQNWIYGKISLKDYLTYATGQNWIDMATLKTDGDYLDSAEVYNALMDYTSKYLVDDTVFTRCLYKYLIKDDVVTGRDLELALYEQGLLPKDEEDYQDLLSGALNAYDFMVRKIYHLQITPAQLALEPCSASCVITDVNTGKVIACVSYPGYNVNRLANNMDTEYYTKLALD
ncbi:MAG: peptidase, partial [Clostridiales bacterium]|nr:peptidase [Candidatus Blautia equi]